MIIFYFHTLYPVRDSHAKEKKLIEHFTCVSVGAMCDKSDNSDKEESDKKKSRKNKTAENMKQSYLFSSFVPEFIDNNKITIVWIL